MYIQLLEHTYHFNFPVLVIYGYLHRLMVYVYVHVFVIFFHPLLNYYLIFVLISIISFLVLPWHLFHGLLCIQSYLHTSIDHLPVLPHLPDSLILGFPGC